LLTGDLLKPLGNTCVNSRLR